MNILKSVRISPFLKDIVATTTVSILTVVSFIFVTRILAEGLGPEGFGSYSLARRILATLEPLATLNMGIAIARYTAIKNENNYSYLFSGLSFGFLSSVLLLAVALFFRKELAMLFFKNENYVGLLIATFLLIPGYSCFVIWTERAVE